MQVFCLAPFKRIQITAYQMIIEMIIEVFWDEGLMLFWSQNLKQLWKTVSSNQKKWYPHKDKVARSGISSLKQTPQRFQEWSFALRYHNRILKKNIPEFLFPRTQSRWGYFDFLLSSTFYFPMFPPPLHCLFISSQRAWQVPVPEPLTLEPFKVICTVRQVSGKVRKC